MPWCPDAVPVRSRERIARGGAWRWPCLFWPGPGLLGRHYGGPTVGGRGLRGGVGGSSDPPARHPLLERQIEQLETATQAAWDQAVEFEHRWRETNGALDETRRGNAALRARIDTLEAGLPPASSEVFLANIPHIHRLPAMSTWPEIEDIFNAEFDRAFAIEIDVPAAIARVIAKSEDAFARAAADRAATP